MRGRACQVIVVGDCENDIYPALARRPPGAEMIVRAARDRDPEDGGLLFAQAAGWSPLGIYAVEVAPRGPGDEGRTAIVILPANDPQARPKSRVQKFG